MELSINLDYLRRQRHTQTLRPLETVAAWCAQAGFRYLDYSGEYARDDWQAEAYRQREALDAAGLSVEQTHAPFNRYGSYEPALFAEYYRRAFETSRILGAKYVVVHADEYRPAGRYDEQQILSYTCDFLAPWVDFAAKNGLVVAVENLFEDKAFPEIDGKNRYTARVEELLAVIERFHTPEVGCCWDFGHARCAFGDGMLDALRQAAPYLVCTHVHDNNHREDQHLLPFLGEIDWEAHMALLREHGYQGKLSFEFVYGRIPDALIPSCLETARRAGETLLAMAGNFDA